jgi:hypothetical protein
MAHSTSLFYKWTILFLIASAVSSAASITFNATCTASGPFGELDTETVTAHAQGGGCDIFASPSPFWISARPEGEAVLQSFIETSTPTGYQASATVITRAFGGFYNNPPLYSCDGLAGPSAICYGTYNFRLDIADSFMTTGPPRPGILSVTLGFDRPPDPDCCVYGSMLFNNQIVPHLTTLTFLVTLGQPNAVDFALVGAGTTDAGGGYDGNFAYHFFEADGVTAVAAFSIPEPSTPALLPIGLLAITALRRKAASTRSLFTPKLK